MIHQSPNDPRQYRYITLDNAMPVLLVHQPDIRKASCSVAVRVGHFDDPDDRHGLAHFLEHMLFLGTEKYPAPDAYPQFISSHGGRNNAWTGTEFTNYFFDVDHRYLAEAMDRFSQFFIAPLLDPQYVDKERNAVDSEYKLKLKDGLRRRYQVHKETVNGAHPFSKFSVGSLDTLDDTPERPLFQDLMDFYNTHYSANLMRMVVLGPQPLDELASLAQTYFSAVPDRGLSKQLPDVDLYRPEDLGLRIRLKPIKDVRRLYMTFPMPSLLPWYRQKPLSYLTSLLGWEGEGSLLSLLKRRGLANHLSAGGGIGGYNFKDMTITIGLTAQGVEAVDEVVGHLFEFIALLRQRGFQHPLYQDRAQLSQLAFEYQEQAQPMDWASHLAVNLHHYPAEDVIRGDYCMDGLSDELYENIMSYLVPERLRMTVVSPEQATDRTTQWYSAEYGVEPLAEPLLQQWQSARPHPELKLPSTNPWIPHHPQLWPQEQGASIPEKIQARDDLSLWYKQDREFNVPRGFLFLGLDSMTASMDPINQAMSRLMTDLAADSLAERFYAAEVAGFNYRLHCGLNGLGCQVGGYSEHQIELVEKVLEHLLSANFDPSRFDELKQLQLRAWHNAQANRPLNRLFNELALLCQPNHHASDTLADALQPCSFEDIKGYAHRWYQTLHIRALGVGNWRRQEMDQLVDSLDRTLLSRARPQAAASRQLILLPGEQSLQRSIATEHHGDSAMLFYYQSVDDKPETQAKFALTSQVMGPEFFRQLRTEKQLGYQLGASYFPLAAVPGLIAYLQSPVAEPVRQYQEIDTFMQEFPAYFAKQDEAWWQKQKEALTVQLQEPETNLGMRAQRYWVALGNGDYHFDNRERVIAEVEQLDKPRMTDFLQQLVATHPLLLSCQGTNHGTSAALQAGELITDPVGFKQQHSRFSGD